MARFCTECGAENQDGSRFCQSCGRPMTEAGNAGGAPPVLPEVNIEYTIEGGDMQFVEIDLPPGGSVIAEAGAMMFMEQGIRMETIFGDGSRQESSDMKSKLFSAGKRMLAGESLFMTAFTNGSSQVQKVAYAAPYPGKIIVLDLSEFGGQIICQKDSFLCGERGTKMEIAFQKKVGVALFGGEGLIMQRLIGNRKVFLHSGGSITKKELKAGEILRLDTGCLVAMTSTVGYDVEFANIKTALFSGEGLALATLTGPGTVWLQSLPFSRIVDMVKSMLPSGTSGSSKDEGPNIGGINLGNLFGDR